MRFGRAPSLQQLLGARQQPEKHTAKRECGFWWGDAAQQARRGAPRSPFECFEVKLLARFFQVSMKPPRVFGRISDDVSIRGRIESGHKNV